MPCITPEPDRNHVATQHAAKLTRYLYHVLKQPCPGWVSNLADNAFASSTGVVPLLCTLLTDMDSDKREAIVYNAHDRTARELATWWEDHQAKDREREAEVAQAVERIRAGRGTEP
jgi:hypothetical protein